jgi:hypothetical protein
VVEGAVRQAPQQALRLMQHSGGAPAACHRLLMQHAPRVAAEGGEAECMACCACCRLLLALLLVATAHWPAQLADPEAAVHSALRAAGYMVRARAPPPHPGRPHASCCVRYTIGFPRRSRVLRR